MKKVSVEKYDKIPSSFYYRDIVNGEGACGICFLTKDGRVYKEFDKMTPRFDTLKYISEYYDSPHMASAETFVFDNKDNFVGYLRELVEGDAFARLPEYVKVRDLLKAVCELEKEMIQNAKNGLDYIDLNPGNLIYTPDKTIKVIDHDLFTISYEDDKERIFDALYELSTTIGQILGCSSSENSDIDSIVSRTYSIYSPNFIRPSQMLEMLIEYAEKHTKEEVETYSDLSKKLQLCK